MEVTFKHSGNAGDIVYSLAAIKAYKDANPSHRIILALNLNVPAFYYKGAEHPVKNGGREVMLNEKMADLLQPLLLSRFYIDDVQIYKGEKPKVLIDLDRIRREDCGMPYLPIQRWYSYLFPDLYVDISKAWIAATFHWPPSVGKVVINRTSRYINRWADYRFLRNYDQSRILFVGLEEEYHRFCEEFDLTISYQPVNDFDELAAVIHSCAFFIGNQSMAFGLAEAMKVPRILETCDFAPNVIPVGENAYDFLYTEGLQYYFDKLYKSRCNDNNG